MVDWIKGVIQSIGYPGIALLMVVENVFPPIPSEVIMPFAGFVTTDGSLSLLGVILAGTTGSVVGALPLYYVGYRVGEERIKRWADRHGHWLMLTGEDIERAQRWFHEHGAAAVFFCRLVPGIRSLISIPAGMSGMNVGLFLLLSALGSGIWAGILAYLGQLLGQNYDQVSTYLGPATYVVFGALVTWYVVYLVRHHWRRGT